MDTKFQNKFIQGYCNGFLFSLFLGAFGCPFDQIAQTLSKQQVRVQYAKYIGITLLKFPPMPALFTLTCDYLKNEGYDTPIQYGAAFALGALYFSVVKYK